MNKQETIQALMQGLNLNRAMIFGQKNYIWFCGGSEFRNDLLDNADWWAEAYEPDMDLEYSEVEILLNDYKKIMNNN